MLLAPKEKNILFENNLVIIFFILVRVENGLKMLDDGMHVSSRPLYTLNSEI